MTVNGLKCRNSDSDFNVSRQSVECYILTYTRHKGKSPNISVFSDDRTIFSDRDNPPTSNTEERIDNGYICSISMRKRKKEMAPQKKADT